MSVQELELKVTSVPERAKGLQILTDEDFRNAGELLIVIKGLRSEINDTFDPIISKAHEAHKEAIGQKKKVDAPLVEAELILKPRISAYIQVQEKRRLEEQRLLEQKLKEEEELRVLEKAEELHAFGDTDEANELLEKPVYVPPVVLPRTTPNVPGIVSRTTWSAQVTNFMELVKAVAAGRAPIQCLKADTVFLGQQARSMKSALNYPGVKAVPDDNIAAGRR